MLVRRIFSKNETSGKLGAFLDEREQRGRKQTR
jgi:hypothetical protein